MTRSEAYFGTVLCEKKYRSHLRAEDKERKKIIGNGNKGYAITAATGGGKDAISQAILDVDMKQGRTPIIIDTKMEYPALIFPQQDTTLKNKLLERGLFARGYNVDLWIPYTPGLEKNTHFKKLCKCVHPKLRVRPFRILSSAFQSPDAKSGMLGFSRFQSMIGENKELKETMIGVNKQLQEWKETVGRKVMILDDYDMRSELGNDDWEYMDFNEVTTGRKIHVISTFFMMQTNVVVALSTAIGLLTELFGRAMDIRKNTFAVYIPELQLLQPKGQKNLQDQSKALELKIKFAFLLMRSFYARPRINLQNLSKLDKDLYSQCEILCGRTTNPEDVDLLEGALKVPKEITKNIGHWKAGEFYSVGKKRKFSIIPQAHKAKEQQPFVKIFDSYFKNPENFLTTDGTFYYSETMRFWTSLDMIDMSTYKAQERRYLRKLRKTYQLRVKKIDQDMGKIRQAAELLGTKQQQKLRTVVPGEVKRFG